MTSYSIQCVDSPTDDYVPSILNQFEFSTPANAMTLVGRIRPFSVTPIAGHNPLLNQAARLFSILHQCELYRKSVQLSLLHHELKQEIASFKVRAEHDYAHCQ